MSRGTSPSGGWIIDYGDPSDFVRPLYTPLAADAWPGGFSGKAVGRRLRAALPIVDATARARAFADLDADFARAAAAAPFAVNLTTGFFSDRIGCQIHHPLYGISLGALCLRP